MMEPDLVHIARAAIHMHKLRPDHHNMRKLANLVSKEHADTILAKISEREDMTYSILIGPFFQIVYDVEI